MIKTTIITEDSAGETVRTPALINLSAVTYYYEGFYYGTVVAMGGCIFLIDMTFQKFAKTYRNHGYGDDRIYRLAISNDEARAKIVDAWIHRTAIACVLDTDKLHLDFKCSFIYTTDGHRFLTIKNFQAYELD